VNPLGSIYKLYEMFLWRQIKGGPKPQHIGLILDGNRRFAESQGLISNEGHSVGSDTLEEFLGWCWKLDVRIITLFAFSTENFNRADEEVSYLMELIQSRLVKLRQDPLIAEQQVKVRVIGRKENLPLEMNREINLIEAQTRDHERFQLNIALSYGGRAEIIDAVKRIANELLEQQLTVGDVTEDLMSRYLYTEGIPDPDLIIRTSGEERLSGFMLWQSAYSELYFTQVYWPAFRMIDFWRAIRTYQQRERRFGR
jgi:tritrans,polycis-undecaprenyl-diphosphate synthase [geranylgeranyl-diphosphate specific]